MEIWERYLGKGNEECGLSTSARSAVCKRFQPTQPCFPSEAPRCVLAGDAKPTHCVDVVHLIVKENHVLEGDAGCLVQILPRVWLGLMSTRAIGLMANRFTVVIAAGNE